MATMIAQVRPMPIMPITNDCTPVSGGATASGENIVTSPNQSVVLTNMTITSPVSTLIGQPQVLASVMPSPITVHMQSPTSPQAANPPIANAQPVVITAPTVSVQPHSVQNVQVNNPVYQLLNVNAGGTVQALLVPVQQVSQITQPILVHNSSPMASSTLSIAQPGTMPTQPLVTASVSGQSLLRKIQKSDAVPAKTTKNIEEILNVRDTGKIHGTSNNSGDKVPKRKRGRPRKTEKHMKIDEQPMFKIESVYSLSERKGKRGFSLVSDQRNTAELRLDPEMSSNETREPVSREISNAEGPVIRGDNHQVLTARHVVAQLQAQRQGKVVFNQSDSMATGDVPDYLNKDDVENPERFRIATNVKREREYKSDTEPKQPNKRKPERFTIDKFSTQFTTLVQRRNVKSEVSQDSSYPVIDGQSATATNHRETGPLSIEKDRKLRIDHTHFTRNPMTEQEMCVLKQSDTSESVSIIASDKPTRDRPSVRSLKLVSSPLPVVPPFTIKPDGIDSVTTKCEYEKRHDTNVFNTINNHIYTTSAVSDKQQGQIGVSDCREEMYKKYETQMKPRLVPVHPIDIPTRISIDTKKLHRQRKRKRLKKKISAGFYQTQCQCESDGPVCHECYVIKPEMKEEVSVNEIEEGKRETSDTPDSDTEKYSAKARVSANSLGKLSENGHDDPCDAFQSNPVKHIAVKSNKVLRHPVTFSNKDRARANFHNVLHKMVHKTESADTNSRSTNITSYNNKHVPSVLSDNLNMNCETAPRPQGQISMMSSTTASHMDVENNKSHILNLTTDSSTSPNCISEQTEDIMIIDLSSTALDSDSANQQNGTDLSQSDLHTAVFSNSAVSLDSQKASNSDGQQEEKVSSWKGRQDRISKLKAMLIEQQEALEKIRTQRCLLTS